MTALREQMIRLAEEVPENQIPQIISFIEHIRGTEKDGTAQDRVKALQAYRNLQKYRRRGTEDIDYKEEIAVAMEKKYDSIG